MATAANSAANIAIGSLNLFVGLPSSTSRVISIAKIISTDIAPTYTRTCTTAKNSARNRTNMPATPKNDTIRNSAALNKSLSNTTPSAAMMLDTAITQNTTSASRLASVP